MARLIVEWLNEEIVLSRQIYSLEEDFKDGYLLGELLNRYNQQPDFNKFLDKGNPDAKINNFCLLENTMRKIGIQFNSKTAIDIMAGKIGVMKNLLYELRTVLERITKSSKQLKMPKNVSQLHKEELKKAITTINAENTNNKILLQVQPARPKYDKSMAETFENTIRTIMENPNDVMMDKVLQRYKDRKTELRQTVSFGYSNLMGEMQTELQRQREIAKHRKEHEAEFTAAWEMINVEQWKKNQKTAHDRRELIKKLELNTTTKAEIMKTRAFNQARTQTIDSIDAFDKRLETEVFREDASMKQFAEAFQKSNVVDPESGVPEVSYIDQSVLQSGLELIQKKMKEHHEDALDAAQVNERRRRKFSREHESEMASSLQAVSEAEIVARMLNLSGAEHFEIEVNSEIQRQKDIIRENRYYRDQFILNLEQDLEEKRQRWIAEEANREKEWIIGSRLLSLTHRDNRMKESEDTANKQKEYENACNYLERIASVRAWILSCKDVGLFNLDSNIEINESPLSIEEALKNLEEIASSIPEQLWKDGQAMLNANFPISVPLPRTTESNVFQEYPYSLSEKPLIADVNWLAKGPFQSHDVLSIPSSNEDDLPTGTVITPEGVPISSKRIISEHLATVDSDAYIASQASAVVSSETADFETVPVIPPIPESTPSPPLPSPIEGEEPIQQPNSMLSAPEFLFQTAPKFLLGDVIVAIRCSANPLPEDPIPEISLPSFSKRIILCGISDVARRSFALAINKQSAGNIIILRVEELVHAAANNNEAVIAKLNNGEAIADELYLLLLLEAIQQIPEGKGFVVEDFPNTRKQANQLVQALSGIDYDSRKPQSSDYNSSFIYPQPSAEVMYDISKCNLDLMVYVDSTVGEQLNARTNLNTNEIVFVHENVGSFEGLESTYVPLRPLHTTSLEKSIAEANRDNLKFYGEKLGILKTYNISHYSVLDAIAEEAAKEIIPDIVLSSEEVVEEPISLDNDEEMEIEAAKTAAEEQAEGQSEEVKLDADAPVPDADVILKEAIRPPLPLIQSPVKMPRKLAMSLASIWDHSENYSRRTSKSFFASLRDIRYQVLQRRRLINDTIWKMLIRIDERQQLLNEFRDKFNEIENDFRFDSDCIAELHLQTLELGDALWKICDRRRDEAEAQLDSISKDGIIGILTHLVFCEGSALVQAELNRFINSLHLLFDYTKIVADYDYKSRYCNVLEEALPYGEGTSAAVPAGKGKDAGKGKGKDAGPAAPVPYREPIAPNVLPFDIMNKIPEGPPTQEVVEDPKAKGKAPAKGKEPEPVATNPYDATEKNVLSIIEKWSKGTFTVDRALYENNERLCIVLENSIWHEAERLKYILSVIRKTMESQIQWLNEMEENISKHVKETILSRYTREVLTVDRLVQMIGDAINENLPLTEYLQITSDAIVVRKDLLVIPPPVSVEKIFTEPIYDDRLNDEQLSMVERCLESMQLGSVIIEQDMQKFLDHFLSPVGPLGNVTMPRGLLKHSTAPSKWLNEEIKESLKAKILPITKVAGIDQTVGVLSSQSTYDKLKEFIAYEKKLWVGSV